jgi:hypothetical protein
MSRSNAKKKTAFIVITVLVLAPWLLQSQALTPKNQEPVLTRARDFLQVLYPEFFGRNLFLNVSITQGIDDSWRQVNAIGFDVMRYNPLSERMLNPPVDPKTGKRLAPPENTLLRGQVWFNREGWLHQFEASGEAVRDKQNQEVHQLIESHPEWSEAEALKALKQAGAQYGPQEKDQFLQAIHLEKLEPFMGHLEIKAAEFEGLTEPHQGNFAVLSWRVELEAGLPSGKRSIYILWFEPFEGRLVGAIERRAVEVTHGNR